MGDLVPLEDPNYEPANKPIDGRVPEVVEKWGPRSQLRWFMRFSRELRPAPAAYWQRFYCNSTEHLGRCCISCEQDANEGYTDITEDHCCCVGTQEAYATVSGARGSASAATADALAPERAAT